MPLSTQILLALASATLFGWVLDSAFYSLRGGGGWLWTASSRWGYFFFALAWDLITATVYWLCVYSYHLLLVVAIPIWTVAAAYAIRHIARGQSNPTA